MIGAFVVCSVACASDTTGLVQRYAPAETYFGLQLSQHAINMSLTAPSNTIQLTATPVNVNGDPLAGTNAPMFTAADSNVTVSATGLVTARYVTLGGTARVTVRLQHDNATYIDTAFIRVTATVPAAIASFSIQPPPGDSASRGGENYSPTVTATDVNGHLMAFDGRTSGTNTNYVWFSSSNRHISAFGRDVGRYVWNDTGHVTLYASAWVYGVVVRDSLKFLNTWQLSWYNFEEDTPCLWYRCTAFLGVGGTMTWGTSSTTARDLVFDDSTAVDSALGFAGAYTGRGNIHFPANPNGNFEAQARSFPKAGTYHWRNPQNPAETGVIYVFENPK
jgi:hypothetical protein